MSYFRKRDDRDRDNLIEEIYRQRINDEVSELELDAERAEAYEKMRSRKKFKSFARGFALVMFLICITAVTVFAGYRLLFIIRDVNIVGESPYSGEEICKSSGIDSGLALFSFSSRIAEERLTLELPYIVSLDVDRHIPNSVTLTVISEEPEYYADIYGKIYILSETLRVLGEAGDEDLSSLVRLRLPGIREAETGRIPELRDSAAKRVLNYVCGAVKNSELRDRIDCIDIRDIYALKMVCDGKYLLEFGDSSDVDTRLRIAYTVLQDQMFNNQNKARIDLCSLSETSVNVDNQIDLYE